MLKWIYTEAGLHLEQVSSSLESLIAQRVLLAMRTNQTLHVEPGRASFLVPVNTLGLASLEMSLQLEARSEIAVEVVDDRFVEISLHGSWIAESADIQEGMLITAFSEGIEFFVYELWQVSQTYVSSLA